MKRVILPIAAMAASLATALSANADAPKAPKPNVKATLVECVNALDQLGRSATFEGDMRALGAGNRMEMRFDLQQQLPDRRFRVVQGAGLGNWNTARPNVRRYRFRKRVENLLAPAAYRMVVRFRWLNATGRVIARADRMSPVCRQADLRPNLAIGTLGGRRLPERQARYQVPVRNFGKTDAASVDVGLTVNGDALARQVLFSVPADGGRAAATFVGPRCAPGSQIQISVDPDDRIGETHEDDNAKSVACPATAERASR